MLSPWKRLATHFKTTLAASPTLNSYLEYAERAEKEANARFENESEREAYVNVQSKRMDDFLTMRQAIYKEEKIMDDSYGNQGEDPRLISKAAGRVGLGKDRFNARSPQDKFCPRSVGNSTIFECLFKWEKFRESFTLSARLMKLIKRLK